MTGILSRIRRWIDNDQHLGLAEFTADAVGVVALVVILVVASSFSVLQ